MHDTIMTVHMLIMKPLLCHPSCPARWTGSNTNPNNNAGQGKQGTDRHNVVMLEQPRYAEGNLNKENVFGQFGGNYPQHLDSTTFLGLNRTELDVLALLSTRKYPQLYLTCSLSGLFFFSSFCLLCRVTGRVFIPPNLEHFLDLYCNSKLITLHNSLCAYFAVASDCKCSGNTLSILIFYSSE